MGAFSVLVGIVTCGSGRCLCSDKSLLQEFLLFSIEILIACSLPSCLFQHQCYCICLMGLICCWYNNDHAWMQLLCVINSAAAEKLGGLFLGEGITSRQFFSQCVTHRHKPQKKSRREQKEGWIRGDRAVPSRAADEGLASHGQRHFCVLCLCTD